MSDRFQYSIGLGRQDSDVSGIAFSMVRHYMGNGWPINVILFYLFFFSLKYIMASVKLKLILNSNDELKQKKMFLKLFGNTLISLYFNSNNLLKKLIKN